MYIYKRVGFISYIILPIKILIFCFIYLHISFHTKFLQTYLWMLQPFLQWRSFAPLFTFPISLLNFLNSTSASKWLLPFSFYFIFIFRFISWNFIWYRSIFSLFIWPQITLYEKFTNDLLSIWYKYGFWKELYAFGEYILLAFSYIFCCFL